MSSRMRADNESAYELDSQFDDEDYQSSIGSNSEGEQDRLQSSRSQRRSSVYSTASTLGPDDNSSYLQAAENAMGTLQTLHSSQSSNWTRALKHRSGVVVYVSKEKSYAGGAKKGNGGKGGHFANVFKGEHDIKGFGPAAVFGVVGTRKLWDDWYNEGNLVENLNDTTSLTYMSMKGVVGTSTRDLSLVERVAGNATGTILFVSTSVVTPKVPRVSGRVRASIALNGWVLEPINGGTRVTYYLHVNVKTFVPAFAAVKYLARRPTIISRIDDYLQSHGPPRMSEPQSSPSERTLTNGNGNSGRRQEQDEDDAPPRRRRDSTMSKRSTRSTRSTGSAQTSSGPTGALPVHVTSNTDAASYAEIQKAQKLFKSLLSTYPSNEWSVAQDHKGGKIWMKRRDPSVLPVVKSEATIEGVTTEQVLGSILSEAARREWDVRYISSGVVSIDNGFDQGVHVEMWKGIYPTLAPRHYTIARGVDREDTSTDNGQILLVSRSTRADVSGPKGSTKAQMDVVGWLIEDNSDRSNSVKITTMAQVDVKGDLPPFVYKILVAELAQAATALATYVDDKGYVPFFVRWGGGPAQLLGDGDSDLKTGKAVFTVDGNGEGTMTDGQQKCWLQWSDKMYERGIDVVVVPASAATISRVEGMARTIEFTWSDDVKDGGAKIILKRARHGDGAEDVYLNGEYLDRVVAMDKGTANGGGAGMAKKRAVKKVAAPVIVAAPAPVAEKRPQANGNHVERAPAPVAIRASPIPSRAATPAPPAPIAAAPVAVAVQGYEQGTRRIPEDACLIISPDLYFTRSQCTFIAGLAFAAFLYGKLF